MTGDRLRRTAGFMVRRGTACYHLITTESFQNKYITLELACE